MMKYLTLALKRHSYLTKASSSSAPILLLGETGTGKDLFARYIHRLSDRATNQFVPINCAAIPTELVESILFGHKRGAFTGAMNDQIGKFDLADGGTLFLDELAELPVQTQAKLLRVLQDGFVEPLGEGKTHHVDVRIIAATNQNVRKAIRDGKFREDLYYRLNVGEIQLPPLRKRRSDIPKIALSVLVVPVLVVPLQIKPVRIVPVLVVPVQVETVFTKIALSVLVETCVLVETVLVETVLVKFILIKPVHGKPVLVETVFVVPVYVVPVLSTLCSSVLVNPRVLVKQSAIIIFLVPLLVSNFVNPVLVETASVISLHVKS